MRTEVIASRAGVTRWGFGEGDEIVPGRQAQRLLGGGHRYEAYLASDDLLRAPVVVKIIRPHRVGDPAALEGLRGEARALRRLSHPAVVRSFDAQPWGDRPHIVLEFVEGPRLSTLLRRYGPLGPEQFVPLALHLCSALHYMSARHTVHLDVKPRNIIMGPQPRLIDLSIARTMSELGAIQTPVGTDAQMAPEQCDPARFDRIGPPSDVWGLGVTLYESLTRSLPFPHTSEPYPQLRWAPRPLPDSIPGDLGAPVMACLREDPATRPTATELTDALEGATAALSRRRPRSRFGPRS